MIFEFKVVGIAFPIAIMLLVPIRQYLMPLLFSPEHLRELDMADYEEAPPISHKDAIKVIIFKFTFIFKFTLIFKFTFIFKN